MVTKTISNQVNRSLRSGHLVFGPVLFPAVSFRKRPAQALRWLSITKKRSGILLIRFNGCASEDKANNSLVKSTKPYGAAILTDIYIQSYWYYYM